MVVSCILNEILEQNKLQEKYKLPFDEHFVYTGKLMDKTGPKKLYLKSTICHKK